MCSIIDASYPSLRAFGLPLPLENQLLVVVLLYYRYVGVIYTISFDVEFFSSQSSDDKPEPEKKHKKRSVTS